jgi:hypothetical protein
MVELKQWAHIRAHRGIAIVSGSDGKTYVLDLKKPGQPELVDGQPYLHEMVCVSASDEIEDLDPGTYPFTGLYSKLARLHAQADGEMTFRLCIDHSLRRESHDRAVSQLEEKLKDDEVFAFLQKRVLEDSFLQKAEKQDSDASRPIRTGRSAKIFDLFVSKWNENTER